MTKTNEFIADCLRNYAEILKSGQVDGAGHYLPDDIESAADTVELNDEPCPSCGGRIGRDCYDTMECAEIARTSASSNSWHTACVQLLFTKGQHHKLFHEIKQLAETLEFVSKNEFDTHRDLCRAASALLNNLWLQVYSSNLAFDENWEIMDRRFPQARWLLAALKAFESEDQTVWEPITEAKISEFAKWFNSPDRLKE